MDFYKIGALKVFADLGALIDEDEKNRTKFSDLPTDLIQIIKTHVTNFKDKSEEYNFLRNFKQGKNKDLYKYFFNKEPHYFIPEVVTRSNSIESNTYKYEYKFYFDHFKLDNVLEYVNKKYQKDYDRCKIIYKFVDGIQKKGLEKYISIGYNEMIINKNNKLQFDYGYKGLSKEYNIPENLKTYLNKNNVWNLEIF